MKLLGGCRHFIHVGVEQEALHGEFFLHQFPHVVNRGWVILIVIVADHAAANHAAERVHARECRVQRGAPDIVEIDVDALGAGLRNGGSEITAGFVIHCCIGAQGVCHQLRLFFTADDAHDVAAAQFGDLGCHGAGSASRGTDQYGFSRLDLANFM